MWIHINYVLYCILWIIKDELIDWLFYFELEIKNITKYTVDSLGKKKLKHNTVATNIFKYSQKAEGWSLQLFSFTHFNSNNLQIMVFV